MQTSNQAKSNWRVTGLACGCGVVLCGGLGLLFPLQVTCGHLFYTCTPAPDPNGYIQRYYEVEPVGITLLETLIGENLHIYYSSGYDSEKIR